MRVTRKLVSLSVLFVAALFVQNVPAATTDILPESSHYEGRAHFGFPTSDGLGVGGYVDFAVYDTEGPNGDEFAAAGFAAPGTGQYIYAYQVFSESFSTDVIKYFDIVGIGDNSIVEPLNDNIGEVEDSEDPNEWGVKPDRSYITFTDDDEPEKMIGVWEFDNGLLTADTHSWFLVLRSTHNWAAGTYTFEPKPTTLPLPTTNPEPATIGLLGIGTLMLFRRRKSVLVQK